jgi:hypothetical protein
MLCKELPNGKAQPPAEEDEVGERHGGTYETHSQKRPDSASRLERNVGQTTQPVLMF